MLEKINLAFERPIFKAICEVASSLGINVYAVGGMVRDLFLNRKSKDIDFVCIGDGPLFAQELVKYLNINTPVHIFKNYGTAMFKYQDLEIEFVGARKESYSSHSRNPVVESGTLIDDLNRRDFTVNALAISCNSTDFGTLIDPFLGLNHLNEKILKTPFDPNITFSDDPLRMLRGIRFACQLGFEIDENTLDSITQNAYRIDIISKERVYSELSKIIMADVPSRGFQLLFDTGLLKLIIPELTDLSGVETINDISHKDNFTHTLHVLNKLSQNTKNEWLRWAALFHDIGKGPTKKFEPNIGWTFHGHEHIGAFMVHKIFKRQKMPLDSNLKYVQDLVRLHLRPISLTNKNITDSAIRRLLFDAGGLIDDLMLLCEADITSKNELKVNKYLSDYKLVRQKLKEIEEKDHIRNWQPPISGDIILKTFKVDKGPIVGELKNEIKEAILDGVIPNNFEDAYTYLLTLGKLKKLTLI